MKAIQSKLILITLFFVVAFAASAKETVTFNVMLPGNAGKGAVDKSLSGVSGVLGTKTNLKEGTVVVTYNEKETSIAVISAAFKKSGIMAFPIGENCSTKKGGCLNNAPTEINTMK